MTGEVDLRCPNEPGMFGKLLPQAHIDPDTNLLQFTCRGCKAQEPDIVRVIHFFNPLGDLVDTVTYRTGGAPVRGDV
jgi:hypothetical protein